MQKGSESWGDTKTEAVVITILRPSKASCSLASQFQARLERVRSKRGLVMNIEWDYSYYQPWSDNEWLVDEMLAILDEDVMMQ